MGGRRRIAARIESPIRCMPVALPSLFCIVEEQFLAKKFNVALLCFALLITRFRVSLEFPCKGEVHHRS